MADLRGALDTAKKLGAHVAEGWRCGWHPRQRRTAHAGETWERVENPVKFSESVEREVEKLLSPSGNM